MKREYGRKGNREEKGIGRDWGLEWKENRNGKRIGMERE
jgi:hypothetical protein